MARQNLSLATLVMAALSRAAKFDMQGHCAAVVTLQKWVAANPEDGRTEGRWDMRIKVHPWTIFGKVHVSLRGNDIATERVFGGAADELGGSALTVSLSPTPVGGDDQFEMSGTGTLMGDPMITCSDLATEEEIEHGQCALGAHMIIKGFQPGEDGETGQYGLLVHLDTWVEPSHVTVRTEDIYMHTVGFAYTHTVYTEQRADHPQAVSCTRTRGWSRGVG